MNQQFDFYIDEKITTWERTQFNVTADSYEEAVEKAKVFLKPGCMVEEKDDVEILECRTLSDTNSYLTPEQNEGASTRQLYNYDDDKLLGQNGNIPM